MHSTTTSWPSGKILLVLDRNLTLSNYGKLNRDPGDAGGAIVRVRVDGSLEMAAGLQNGDHVSGKFVGRRYG